MRIRLSFWMKSKNAKLEVNDSSFYFRDGTPAKLENSYSSLLSSFERAERTSKSFAAKFENQGEGLYFFAGIKTVQTKNYVLFIDSNMNNAVIQVRTKNGIEKFNIQLSVGGEADNKVMYGVIHTDEAETVQTELETVAPVVSTLKSRDHQILELLNKLAESKALIAKQAAQIDELLIVNESLKKDNKRLRKEKSDRVLIAETFGEERAESVEKIENELDMMVGLTEEIKLAKTEEQIKTRVSINTETESFPTEEELNNETVETKEIEPKSETITRQELNSLRANDKFKHAIVLNKVNQGTIKVLE